ncbi:potassium channel protein [Tenuibacillus multivorans]|uniref:Voltage-gated potassium channel n=2 Tax=Tenuibacillus multivorans TaxID=237069 RepID=A0A1H0FRR5_9BACI|nr:potassium channel family protein [Tenuibacillus multivorans]GEL77914.1 potassium channel protein [Tenuibacillus multivorans]SDN97241.1 voltage-gated potassium channel [Tenuibacillus multivorans]
MLYRFKRLYFQIPQFIRLLLTIFASMIVFGYIIHLIEPNEFKTVFDGVWWAFITGSTIGYGDYVPHTTIGRLLGISLILLGGGVLTFYMVTFAKTTISRKDAYEKGDVAYKGTEHYIIVGWNERSRRLIQLLQENYEEGLNIVLIDETIDKDPVQASHVHYIRKDPTLDTTWKKANIEQARKIIITADQSKDERDSDTYSILITITARGLNPQIPILVEILTSTQKANAERAGATEAIRTNESTSTLFFHELTSHQKIQTFEYVMAMLSDQEFLIHEVTEKGENRSVLELTYEMKKQGLLLLGMIRDEKIIMNPKPDEVFTKSDKIIFSEKLVQ